MFMKDRCIKHISTAFVTLTDDPRTYRPRKKIQFMYLNLKTLSKK